MKKHKQPDGLAPGIYFGLDEKDYHKDTALSHSGMVDILDSPLDFWVKSSLNPHREFKASDAMIFGQRCHRMLLQEKQFFTEYAVTGQGYDARKKLINRSDFEKIKESVDMIKAEKDAYAYFSNGYPEVVIVWQDPRTGIRLRIMVDWLRTFGGIDYKRSKSVQNNQLGWTIADYGYDIQEALYRTGIGMAKRLLREGKIKAYGKHDPEWLKKFMADDSVLFRFFFQRSVRPFIFRILNMDPEIIQMAQVRIEQAKDIYKHHIEKFGANSWPAGKAEPEEFSIFHLPRRIFDQGT